MSTQTEYSQNIAINQNQILNGRLSLWQPEKGYRSGIDAILLAAFARGQGQIIEAGCGVGTVMLSIAVRCPEARLTGIEIQVDLIPIATRNITENNLQDRVQLLHGDIRNKKIVPPNHCDEMVINPPYIKSGAYKQAETTHKNFSHTESGSGATLADWLDFANYALKPKGVLTMIHRSDRLDEVLATLKARPFGAIEIFPLWPKNGTPSKRFLLRACKDSRAPICLYNGLVLHESDGSYTKQGQEIIRDMKAIIDTEFKST